MNFIFSSKLQPFSLIKFKINLELKNPYKRSSELNYMDIVKKEKLLVRLVFMNIKLYKIYYIMYKDLYYIIKDFV